MTMNSGSPFCDNTGSTPDPAIVGQGTSGMETATPSMGQSGSKVEQARAQASDAAKELQGAASQATSAVTDATKRSAQQAKDAANRMVGQAKGQAKQLTQQATEQGTQMLNDQKSRAADSLGGIGSALRRAAQTLHEEQDENLARYTESLADGVDSGASYLRDHDFRSLLNDAGDIARRRPELVLGGAFIAGLALVRFLKASSPSNGGTYDRTSGQDGMQYATSDQFMSDEMSPSRHRAGAYPETAVTTPMPDIQCATGDFSDDTRSSPPSSGLTL